MYVPCRGEPPLAPLPYLTVCDLRCDRPSSSPWNGRYLRFETPFSQACRGTASSATAAAVVVARKEPREAFPVVPTHPVRQVHSLDLPCWRRSSRVMLVVVVMLPRGLQGKRRLGRGGEREEGWRGDENKESRIRTLTSEKRLRCTRTAT